MTDTVDESLAKITKGAGIILIGAILGMGLGFLSRVLIVRYVTQAQYGIYSLGLVLVGVFVTVSSLGLNVGVPRQISHYWESDESKVGLVIGSSLIIGLISALLSSFVLFYFADNISISIFHEPGLIDPIRIFSFAIPFSVVLRILVSIFRGFGRADTKVYFQNILSKVSFISFLGLVVVLGLSFLKVIYAYVLSLAVTVLIFAFYTKSNASFEIKLNLRNPVGKELLFFSLPLLATTILNMIMNWTDTLMLGFYEVPEVVGLYQGAYPLAKLIPLVLESMGFIYLPMASKFHSNNQMDNMKRTYQVLTKWIYSASLPVFLFLFLFPGTVLNFVFGAEYVGASFALRVLSLGFMVHALLGVNGLSLVALGKTKLVLYGSLIGAIANIVLNAGLIPFLGILGAAAASAVSYICVNGYNSAKLYQVSNIQPFTKNYLKPIGVSVLLMAIIYALGVFIQVEVWMLPIFLPIYLLVYFVSLLLTRSFDKEDVDILLRIEKRLGMDFGKIKKVLERYS